jgi:hypothetical protein
VSAAGDAFQLRRWLPFRAVHQESDQWWPLRKSQRREATLAVLRADVRTGLDSGPAQNAETVFQWLEQKYSNHSSVLVEP